MSAMHRRVSPAWRSSRRASIIKPSLKARSPVAAVSRSISCPPRLNVTTKRSSLRGAAMSAPPDVDLRVAQEARGVVALGGDAVDLVQERAERPRCQLQVARVLVRRRRERRDGPAVETVGEALGLTDGELLVSHGQALAWQSVARAAPTRVSA